jgi:hypothetical protein
LTDYLKMLKAKKCSNDGKLICHGCGGKDFYEAPCGVYLCRLCLALKCGCYRRRNGLL